jgi:hypothetical protein
LSRVYFTDRDLGKQFGVILKSGGLTFERHADHFAHDTPDEAWLAEVGRTEGAIRVARPGYLLAASVGKTAHSPVHGRREV